MSINLLETIQQKLGYQPLQKIDPNTQEVVENSNTPAEDKLSQAAVPSALIALYNYSTTPQGAITLLKADPTDWAGEVFGDFKLEAIQKIAAYSHKAASLIEVEVNKILTEAISIVRSETGDSANAQKAEKILEDQRNVVLHYLPASLQMGQLLKNPTLDDRTNKMEGPVSNLMHAIGNVFSSSDTDTPKPKNY